jgi:hypothetical protein
MLDLLGIVIAGDERKREDQRMSKSRKAWLGLATWALFSSMTALAQNQGGAAQKPSAPPVGTPKTVVGCLTGYDGHYTLGASNDTLYLLIGDSALFKRYNARMVQVTGTVSEPRPATSANNVLSQQPPTLTVSTLKKVADGCN